MATTVLVFGNPAEGFTIVGPVTPNDPELERFTDHELRDTSWWYVTMQTLDEVRA